jgi:mono/diheme cytochrome c family protein
MTCHFRWIGLLGLATLVLLRLDGEGRPAESLWAEIYKSAWAGILTNDQAARGELAFRERCASCHGASLEGSEAAPPLAGRDFMDDWNGTNIADLFEKIQYSMPPSRPGRLGEKQIADILSYVLKFNRFPPGSNALSGSADDLRGVRFLAEDPNK